MTAKCRVLLDSNVIVAAVIATHEHHPPSAAVFGSRRTTDIIVAAHSYAEAFTTLTRRGTCAPFQRSADEAWVALERLATLTTLVGVSPAQRFDATRRYASSGGISARLYDFLIGSSALAARAESIVIWNLGDYRPLFPDCIVETPTDFLTRISSAAP